MKLSVLNWLDWEFVEVRCEAQSGKTAAEQGDAFAQSILKDAFDHLADGIVHVITLLCPQRVPTACASSGILGRMKKDNQQLT